MAKTDTLDRKREMKQKRARARRKAKKAEAALADVYKPLEEWDEEELARGRPRDHNGNFQGKAPGWISRELHEEAVKQFTEYSRGEVRGLVPKALATIQIILESDEVDEKGRSVVPYATKLDAAKWVVEHLVGKPTQRLEADISVRLQAVLASALVNPDATGELVAAIDADAWEDEDED